MPRWRRSLPITVAPLASDVETEKQLRCEVLKMDEKNSSDEMQSGRRAFLTCLGGAIAGGAVAAGPAALLPAQALAADSANGPVAPSIPKYDWSKHHWAFGVDATKCIGCLRCVEACKAENEVAGDAHHFRTWVERYVYVEGEDKVAHRQPVRPGQYRRVRLRRALPLRQPIQG